MGHGTTLVAGYRNYEYKNHKIEFHPTKIEAGKYGPFARLGVILVRKNFIGTTTIGNKNVDFLVNDFSETTVKMGTSKSGAEHRYEFFTGDAPSRSWGSLWADPVYTYSYE